MNNTMKNFGKLGALLLVASFFVGCDNGAQNEVPAKKGDGIPTVIVDQEPAKPQTQQPQQQQQQAPQKQEPQQQQPTK